MNIKLAKPSEIPSDWYNSIIGLDIETEDKVLPAPICMVSLHKPNTDTILVIPIHTVQYEVMVDIDPDELEILKDFLRTIRACGHNLQFDLARIMYHWGVECDVYLDTFIIARLFQCEKQGLKDMAVRCKPEVYESVRHFVDVMGDKPPFVYHIDNPRVVRYSGLDAWLPFVIIQSMGAQIKKYENIIRMEMDYLKIAYREQAIGLCFDLDLFNQKVSDAQAEVAQKQAELEQILARPFKCGSTKQKKELFIDQFGCMTNLTTEKGEPSMSMESLKVMRDNEVMKGLIGREAVIDLLDRVMEINSLTAQWNGSKKAPNYVYER